MSKTKSKRWANGLTIIELVTTIVILGIIMVGLGLSLRTVTYHYQDDSVLLDIHNYGCLLYTSPSPRDRSVSRMPSSA